MVFISVLIELDQLIELLIELVGLIQWCTGVLYLVLEHFGKTLFLGKSSLWVRNWHVLIDGYQYRYLPFSTFFYLFLPFSTFFYLFLPSSVHPFVCAHLPIRPPIHVTACASACPSAYLPARPPACPKAIFSKYVARARAIIWWYVIITLTTVACDVWSDRVWQSIRRYIYGNW